MIEQLEKELYEAIKDLLFYQMTIELERQGHTLTGNLVQSFEVILKDSLTIEFLMEQYGLSLNYGIKPANIPYSPEPRGRGGKSKFIQGLIRWVKLKGIATGDKAKGIAFAIARKQKEKGFPLTGKIGFFDIAIEKSEDGIIRYIEQYIEDAICLLILNYVENTIQ